MVTQEIATSEQSPLLPPSPSSTTEVDESASDSTASEAGEQSKISAVRGTVLGACIAVLIFLQSNYYLFTYLPKEY